LTAAAIFVDGMNLESEITSSYFVECDRSGGRVVVFNGTGKVQISDCCFSDSKMDSVLGKGVSISDKDCRFTDVCEITEVVTGNIGWKASRTPTYTAAFEDDKPVVVASVEVPKELGRTAKAVLFVVAAVLTVGAEIVVAQVSRFARASNLLKRGKTVL
jgi:hypothetical protein